MNTADAFNRLLKNLYYDPQAKEQFFEEYYDNIMSHTYWKFGKFCDWEDIAHDVVRLLLETNWTDYPYVRYPASWLSSIIENHAKDIFRRTNRLVSDKCDVADKFNIDDTILKIELKEKLKKFPNDVRYIIYAHYFEGYSYKEISEQIGLSQENVRVKSCRTMKSLKTLFNLK